MLWADEIYHWTDETKSLCDRLRHPNGPYTKLIIIMPLNILSPDHADGINFYELLMFSNFIWSDDIIQNGRKDLAKYHSTSGAQKLLVSDR